MASTAKTPDPMPCVLAADLLQGSHAFGCRARKGWWFSGPTMIGEPQTTVCVVGVWTVHGVRTRRARVAGVNSSFETTGIDIVRRGGAAEGGRVEVVSG